MVIKVMELGATHPLLKDIPDLRKLPLDFPTKAWS